jgi:hypothetical protein
MARAIQSRFKSSEAHSVPKTTFAIMSKDLDDTKLHELWDDFANSTARNAWLEGTLLKVYVRRSRRYWNGALTPTWDLATFQVLQEANQRKGLSRSFIRHVIANAGSDPHLIYVENIQSADWLEKLKRDHGFIDYPDLPGCLLLAVST